MRVYLPLQPPTLQSELLDSNYRYQEFLPSKGLDPYIACYWTIHSKASHNNKLHRIIPDGCIDIIIDLRASSLAKGAFVVGLMTTFETINLTTNYSLFGIRFFADKVRQFIRYPVSELTGHHVLLEDIWGREAVFIAEEVQSAKGLSEMMERIEFNLLKLLNYELQTDQLLQAAMHYMHASYGMVSIRTLAEKLSYSERNVRRTFQNELGVSPKELSGIIRFQYLLQELNKGSQSHFTDIAVKYGYYDQPHFIHNFKRFYGLAPNEVFK
ncbi:Helix-turn-helix domain-containing protein [Paenibacillus sp. 1_12]|uniref:AraC family transcriptional regulator n=1 Tax=Paenibacillus sp. 1_12 TaxID=1566278 RepID=UPI0008F1B372|nr:helix-turn-helix domain-containing protein [Paenibacillus sp. 1_12]SFL24221.1 Helix-turn-helix domain-containing protein [Paenibacillus sp. 1_12]